MNCLIKLYTCAFLLFCVIKDSVVLGDALSKCMTNVHKMFPESNSPKDNFLLAFKDYNQEHFNKLQETNDDAQGYFVDLINSVTDLVGDILDNPETFCQKFHSSKMDKMFHEEVLYILFGKKDKDPETDYGRILCITSELDAFKQFYLTQIYSELKRDHSNSSFHEHQDKLNKYEELDEDAKIRRKKSIMWVYLDQFNRQAELVAKNTKFRKVEAYCHSAIRKRKEPDA